MMHISGEGFFDLGGEFVGESVEALGEITDVLEKIVVGDEGGDGGEQSGGGGNEGFGDAGGDGAQASRTGSAEARKSINDAPDSPEETDEGSDAGGGGKPRHPLFDAADFVGGCKLHADGNGLKRFHLLRRGIAGAGHLRLKFAIAGGVDIGKGRTGGDESLRIGDALGGTEDLEELVALAADAAEETEFLEDKGPRDERKEQENGEDNARDPTRLRQNVKNITDEECG